MSDEYLATWYRAEHFNTNSVVAEINVVVAGIILTAEGGNSGARIYEGVNGSGTLRFRLLAIDGTTVPLTFEPSVLFDRGMYIELDDANANVTVLFV